MTARRATFTLLRAALIAPATVSPAAIVCTSADLFRVPECSKAAVSIPPPKSVCFSSSRSSAAFNCTTTASVSSATTISSTLGFCIASEYSGLQCYACPTPKHTSIPESRATIFVAKWQKSRTAAYCGRLYIVTRLQELNVIATLTQHSSVIFRDTQAVKFC
jgi:hypothetical protein